MTDSDKSVLIGEGTYGKVRKTGSVASKTFKLPQSLIQEYAAGKYLSRCDRIVKVLSVDFNTLTMTMELYSGSIRKWNQTPHTHKQKLHYLKETLKALICLHDLGIVHGDLKPGNILANWDSHGNITKLVLGDLGFVAPNLYSKVQYTAPLYRDPQFEPFMEHDIYSFGVIVIETFGGQIPRKVKKHKKDKIKYCQSDMMPYLAKIKDDNLRELTLRMISEDKTNRPTARYLLRHIFNETIDVLKHPGFPKYPPITILKERQTEITNAFRVYESGTTSKTATISISTSPLVEIKRTKIGYLACINYICNNRSRQICILYMWQRPW